VKEKQEKDKIETKPDKNAKRGEARQCQRSITVKKFWFDCWIRDVPLRVKFPRLFALDLNKQASVAVKLSAPIDVSFRRNARGGLEEHLLADLTSLIDSVTLSNSGDRWVCDLASDGNFRVK
nr:RNA-directed DNA polymerase, eukaryota, reverse transcriptase zinc-binding domain protein [Tanacetum cinerariifolium]